VTAVWDILCIDKCERKAIGYVLNLGGNISRG
jgi:hypothetical protein